MNQVAPDRTSDTAEKSSLAVLRCALSSRCAVRAFALLAIAVMVIDSAPHSWNWLRAPKKAVSAVVARVGLWQGEWAMFSPEPVLNNGWFTAEIQNADGTQAQWNSPYWNEANNRDKFLRFRHLNYFNRMPSLMYHAAREDFLDYLARQSDVPVESIKLYHTRMRLIMPEDGSLPKRDEVDWMFSSEIMAKRTYQQPSDQK